MQEKGERGEEKTYERITKSTKNGRKNYARNGERIEVKKERIEEIK